MYPSPSSSIFCSSCGQFVNVLDGLDDTAPKMPSLQASSSEGLLSGHATKKRKTGLGEEDLVPSLDAEILQHAEGRRQKLEEALILQMRAQRHLQDQLEVHPPLYLSFDNGRICSVSKKAAAVLRCPRTLHYKLGEASGSRDKVSRTWE